MKIINIYSIVLLIILSSCKRNDKPEFQHIDTPSLSEMITNYQTFTEGEFTFACFDSQVGENSFEYKCGFGGLLYNKLENSTLNLKSIKLGKITVGTLDIPVTPHLNTTDNKMYYFITTPPSTITYITSLFNNQTVPVKVYDTLMREVTSFNFITPQKLRVNRRDAIVTRTEFPNATFTWNADPTNKIGMVAEIIVHNAIYEKKAVFLADDGIEKISTIVGDFKGQVDVTLYRGAVIIKKGSDDRNYKIICKASSSFGLDIE